MESGLTVHVDNARVMRALRATWLACKPGPQTAGLMRAVGYYIRKQTDQHFRDEKGPQGAWKALKDATVARRRKGKRKDVGHKILQDTGTPRPTK
jgi:phage gpG-like protein